MHSKDEFIAIIKENEAIIYKITRVYTNTTEDQKDLYQEIVYQLWKSFPSFKGASKISTWMYRVALNTSISYLNKHKRKAHPVVVDFQLLNLSEENDTMMEDRMQLLYRHIQELSVIEKGIILLYLEGKNYEEISAITGFTITNVGTRLGRIKQKLKANIHKL